MAELKMINRTKYDTANAIIGMGEQSGGIKIAYDKYTYTAAPSDADTLLGPKLPKGARVLDVILKGTTGGGTGDYDFGWAATLDEDGATLAADPNGLIDNLDTSAGAAIKQMVDDVNLAGQFIKFGQETQTYLTFVAGPTTATGTVEVAIVYVVD